MAGYWPKEQMQGQYPAILTEQTWLIKDLLYGFKGNFSCGIQQVVPRGQDGSILPTRAANHSAQFGSSCPLVELHVHTCSHIINCVIIMIVSGRLCEFLNRESSLTIFS